VQTLVTLLQQSTIPSPSMMRDCRAGRATSRRKLFACCWRRLRAGPGRGRLRHRQPTFCFRGGSAEFSGIAQSNSRRQVVRSEDAAGRSKFCGRPSTGVRPSVMLPIAARGPRLSTPCSADAGTGYQSAVRALAFQVDPHPLRWLETRQPTMMPALPRQLQLKRPPPSSPSSIPKHQTFPG